MKTSARRLLLPLLILTLLTGSASAQSNIFSKLFEPKILEVTNKLRAFIRDDLPAPTHDRSEELKHIDMIFLKSMELANKQISTALLACSIAVLNRTDIKPTLPILGIITLPLPAEDSAEAVARINKLPRYFLSDSPQDGLGDSDKLVHFFGSAYLTYETGTSMLPDAIGKLIEQGEVAFKLDTAADPRDVFANRLGQHFGAALSNGRDVIPSDFLRAKYIKK